MNPILDYSDSYWFVAVFAWHSAISEYDRTYWTYYSCWDL
jgi:hypothetical protein